jgi:hypothetical protein
MSFSGDMVYFLTFLSVEFFFERISGVPEAIAGIQ